MRALLLIALVACGSTAAKPGTITQRQVPLLYDRIGGMDAIKAIVKDFVEEQLVKGPLAARFAKVDIARLEDLLARQLCEQTGGPCKYTGRSMREAHGSLAVSDAELATYLDAFAASLEKLEIDAGAQRELLDLLRKQRDEIVTAPQ